MSWVAGPHPDDAVRPVVPERPFSPHVRRPPVVIRPRADTRAVGVLQLLPLAPGVLVAVATSQGLGVAVALVVSLVAMSSAGFVFARGDAHVLRSRGFSVVVPAVVALLSPLPYLVARAHACSQHDRGAWWPVWWAIAASVISAALVAGEWWLFGAAGLL